MSQETPASPTGSAYKNKTPHFTFLAAAGHCAADCRLAGLGSYKDRGNTITIDFMSADGIVAGRTPIRYQGVEVGTVQDIRLSEDLKKSKCAPASKPI